MLDSTDQEMGGDTPVPSAELLNQLHSNKAKSPKKRYRIWHKREDGIHVPVLLQNRIIEAESPEQALRLAMDPLGLKSIEIHSTNEYTASASQPDPSGNFVDVWQAEAENLRYSAAM
jgi:hypothetical protein